MPLFRLPIANTAQTATTRPQVQLASLPFRESQKRKRDTTDDDDDYAENEDINANPLSLKPAEVVQYRLAGLRLDKELPTVKGWPHRGLSDSDSDEDVVDTDGEDKKARRARLRREREKNKTGIPKLRLQHMGVLVAMMMRCLESGDMTRAVRAWSLLIRSQFGGSCVDLRASGYWGIGAELLVRGKEGRGAAEPAGAGDAQTGGLEADVDAPTEKRWGTKDGLLNAKAYYERLILEHPYKRQFSGSVTALDFWPAMLSCEIYGIQYEWKEGLRSIDAEAQRDEAGDISGSDLSSEDEGNNADPDSAFSAYQRRQERRARKRAEKRWERKDDVRKTALVASHKVAARMHELMGAPPYSDSAALLRLRGMLSLYIGDLSVPDKWEDGNGDAAEENMHSRLRSHAAQRRSVGRQKAMELKMGKEERGKEREKAKKFFEKIGMDGYEFGIGADGGHDEYDDEKGI